MNDKNFSIFLLGHLVILFDGTPKPEACWSDRSSELCEELVLTAGAQRD